MSSGLAGRLVRIVLLALTCLGLCLTVAAQSTTEGAIGGVITDPQSAVVPNATITVHNNGTNREDTATSDAAGRFRVIHLQPATYTVSVTAAGFAAYKQENVVVEVGRVTGLDVALAITGKTEVVEVRAETPVIQTEQHDFNSNINQVSLNELPINGRRWSQYALLTPGTSPDGDFGLISFRGISGLLNNNTVDGGDNNQAFFSEERGRTRSPYSVSQTAIREFQINTSNFSAEYGRAAGGVVNAVTKSGTNRLHGDVFYYNRNNELGATNPFTRQSTLVNGVVVTQPIKPENVRHQFGGDIGGPIIKDKIFFFFNYDQQKNNFPGVAATSDPRFITPFTVAAPVAGRTCTNSGLSGLTAGQQLAVCGVSQAQADAAIAYLLNQQGLVPRKGDQYLAFPKFDFNLGRNHRLFLSYNRMRWNSPAGVQTGAVVARGRSAFGNDFVFVDSVQARLTSSFGSRFSNEFRYQWGRDKEPQFSQAPLAGEPTTGPGGLPPQACIGCSSSGSFNNAGIRIGKPEFLERYANPYEKRNQVADSFTIAAGRHLFKVGVDYNHVWDLLDNLFLEGGEYNYTNLVDWVIDFSQPQNRRYSGYQQGFGPRSSILTTNDYNFFVQDDFRVNSRLTLNLGMRYEYEQLPDPQNPNPLLPLSSSFPSDNNNLGPRLGFALDVSGNGKTALRGGYGIYYGRVINSTISNAITNTGTANAQKSFTVFPTATGAPTYPNVLSAAPVTSGSGSAGDVIFFAKDFNLPMIHEADLVLEQEVARNTVLSASWLFSKGTNLPIFLDTNLTAPTETVPITYIGGPLDGKVISMAVFRGTRPNAGFGRMTAISSKVDSNYNAGVIQLNRRFSGGLQFQTSYTFSHALDTGQDSQTFSTGNNALNPFDLSGEKGNSSFDVRHRFVTSIVWSPTAKFENRFVRGLLNDWTMAPIFNTQTGRNRNGTVTGTNPITGTQAGGVNGAGPTGGGSRVPGLARNFLHMPNPWNLDLRLSRRVRIKEGMNLEFLAEAFNLANHVNGTAILTNIYSWGGTNTAPTLTFVPSVGTVTAASNTLLKERQIQFAARFHF